MSAAKIWPRDSTFKQYKVLADIRGSGVATVPQTTVGWIEPATCSYFDRHIFGTFRVEANIIIIGKDMGKKSKV